MQAYIKPFRLAAFSLALLACFPAHAFADDEARRAIIELRQQVQQMREQNQQAQLNLAAQIDSLRHEVVTLRGQVEKLGWESSNLRQTSNDGNTQLTASDPQEQAVFDSAMDLYRAGQYQEASESLGAFMDAYPSSVLIDDVRFYQGSSLYALRNYKGASEQLQKMVKESPKAPHAADALMIAASCQIELNDLNGARSLLQRIVKEYPETEAADTARNRLKLLE